MFRISILFFLFSLILNNVSISQPILNWNKIYNFNGHQELPTQVLADDSGNVFVLGQVEISNNPSTNFDALILKYNKYGELLWYRKHSLATSGDDIFSKGFITQNGNILVTGTMQVGNTLKMLNIMYSATGDTIWSDIQDNYEMRLCWNIIQKDSTYYINALYAAGNNMKVLVLKYDLDGQFLGNITSGEFDGALKDICINDSSILISYTQRVSADQRQGTVEKINFAGIREWEISFSDSTSNIEIVKSIYDKDNNIYTLNNVIGFDSTAFIISKINEDGNLIWSVPVYFGSGDYSTAMDLRLTENDFIQVVGNIQHWDGVDTETSIFIALYDSMGVPNKFSRRIISNTTQNLLVPKYDEFGNIYIPCTISNPSFYTDISIIKLDTDDNLEYELLYIHNNSETISENAVDLYIVDEDNFVITATEAGIAEAYNILTLRYGSNISSIDNNISQPISTFEMKQNYPNPFNPSTNIQYAISSRQFVTLKVYDVLGKEIATLVNEEKATGKYAVNFNAGSLASGIYFYKLQAGDFVQTRKMILLK